MRVLILPLMLAVAFMTGAHGFVPVFAQNATPVPSGLNEVLANGLERGLERVADKLRMCESGA